MYRTQIYLQDTLHSRLKEQARLVGISMSELIRRTLERDLLSKPLTPAQDFFASLKPLQSFDAQTPESYVRELRSRSRILRDPANQVL
jgi:hypothetical protein